MNVGGGGGGGRVCGRRRRRRRRRRRGLSLLFLATALQTSTLMVWHTAFQSTFRRPQQTRTTQTVHEFFRTRCHHFFLFSPVARRQGTFLWQHEHWAAPSFRSQHTVDRPWFVVVGHCLSFGGGVLLFLLLLVLHCFGFLDLTFYLFL